MSVPNAVLSLYFFASATVCSVPANTCRSRRMFSGPGSGGTCPSSVKGWMLSQIPLFRHHPRRRLVHEMAMLDAP